MFAEEKEFLNQLSKLPEEDYCIKKVASSSITHIFSILLEALLLKELYFLPYI